MITLLNIITHEIIEVSALISKHLLLVKRKSNFFLLIINTFIVPALYNLFYYVASEGVP